MSRAQDTTTLTTYLDSFEQALEDGNPADVLAFLRVLRMNGLDDDASSELVEAFSGEATDADFERARQWARDQRAALATGADDDPFSSAESDPFLSVDDDVGDFEDLDDVDDLDDFDDVDDFDAFDDLDDVDDFDAFDDLDDVDDFDAFDDLDDLDAFDDLDDATSSSPDSPSAAEAPESSDSFPPGDEFIDTGSTPAPPPTTDQLSSTSGPSLADDFDSDVSYTPAATNSTITGEREKTRQLDSNHLQALSDAASIAGGGDPTDSSPTTTSENSDVHDRPTKRQFEAPDTGTSSSPVSDDAPDPGTTEMPNPEAFDVADNEVPDSSEQPETADDFDLDFGPESSASPSTDDAPDDDFDFGPESSASPSTDDAPDDDFDFDFGPESSASPSTDDAPDDDFDFDLGPESSSSSAADEAPSFDDPSPLADDKMGYASPPDDDFFPSPIAGDTNEGPTGDSTDEGDEAMGYAAPEDDSFFPPPLSGHDESDGTTASEGDSLASSPTESSSSSESTQTSPTPESPSPRRPQYKTPLFDSSEATFEPNTGAKSSPPESLQEATSQQTAGSEAATGTDHAPLPEEELLALGEELSSNRSTDQSSLKSATAPGEATPSPSPSNTSPGYRGEPVVPEVGDEPTPARSSSVPGEPIPQPGGQVNEPTGSFAAPENQTSATPSGTFPGSSDGSDISRTPDQATPAGGLSPLAASSSFVLEEVRNPESSVSDPGDAIEAALKQARSLYEQGEFDEAMELVDAVFDIDDDCDEARELQGLLEGEMERAEINRLGSLAKTPSLNISMGEIAGLDLDHRAGFLISQIDGMLTFNDILDMSSMSRLETLRVLNDLNERGIIDID